MKVTAEILKNLRILNVQAWEMKSLSRIILLRKTEEIWLKKFVVGSVIIRFIFFNAPTFVAVVLLVVVLL